MTFSFEIIYGPKILFVVLIILNPFFLNCKTTSDGKMTRSKVVDFDETYNFLVESFFIRNHLWPQNCI
jgi:hypothetical protein